MSIGFRVNGTVAGIEELIRKASTIAKTMGYGIDVGEGGMCLRLCPMGEVEITWSADADNQGQWLVESDCQTSQVGAGFHKAALELIDGLELENMVVEDETDYYSHRDFERMKREHFYPYLKQLLQVCHDLIEQRGSDQVCLCWDLDLYHPESVMGTVASTLGRYTLDALDRILEIQGVEALAQRFFLWENETQDEVFYRNRALYGLWIQCYYVSSSRSEMDREINGSILDDLEKSYAMNCHLPFPYEAYREVCGLHGRKPVIEDVEPLAYEFPIGYRKRKIVETLGNLRLTLPGSYLYEWEENERGGGVNLWCDDSVNSPVWRVSAYRAREGQAQFSNGLKGVKDYEEYEITKGRIRFGWEQHGKENEKYYIMECEVITGPSFYLITVCYLKPEEREGIVELLHQISTN